MKLNLGILSIALTVHAIEDSHSASPGTYAFEKYRPTSHFLPRSGRMNAPCGSYYDEQTKLYHLYYQRNPPETIRGEMTWGHAVSADQVFWEDSTDAVKPNIAYDRVGYFTGQVLPDGIDHLATTFYVEDMGSSIGMTNEINHQEHIIYATSSDRGSTWKNGEKPLNVGPPDNFHVTEWRDPFVFESRSLNYAYNESNTYMLVSGGIRDKGPSLFLYASPAGTYTDWKYKGLLFQEEKDTSFWMFSGKWASNFEMSSFMEIEDEYGDISNVVFLGETHEGGQYTLWMFANVGSLLDTSLLYPSAVGNVDDRNYYASNVFKDPTSKKYVVNAWMAEENGRKEQMQGWNGILALPRELGIVTIHDIFDPLHHTSAKANWVEQSHDILTCGGQTFLTSTIKTLSIKPLSGLANLRASAAGVDTPAFFFAKGDETILSSRSKTFELYAEISDFEPGSRVGFRVRQNTAVAEYTSITYDDAEASISIDRSASCNMQCPESSAEFKPATTTKSNYFKIFELVQSSGNECAVQREKLRIRIFVDVSVVEVFVNDRVAISARIYPCESPADASDKISVFSSNKATFNIITVWPILKGAWPQRL